MRTLANNASPDCLTIALQTHRIAHQRTISPKREVCSRLAQLAGCKSAVVRGVIGNSAWGRSMRAKQIIAARWKKQREKA